MHTNGPWVLDPDGEVTDPEGIQTIFVFGPEGQGYGRVAMVYAECGNVNDLQPNARLIAAAPELLDVVRDCVNFLADLDTKSDRAKALHKRAYTAHSKAKEG